MNTPAPANEAKPPPESADFSLVLGGPLYQLLRRARLAGDALQLMRRRLVVLILIAWLPLLLLAALDGHAWSGVKIPFLLDVEMHVRFLFALPLLIGAELVVHQRIQPVIQQFLERNLVHEAARARFDAAIASALRLRNSVKAEVALLAFVYLVGVLWIWRTQLALDVSSWYGVSVDGKLQPSRAGWWLGCVSLPLFQFILLRWYFRLFIWARLLWQISRIKLNLIPTHPDRCCGLGFLSQVSYAFAPLLLAQGSLLAGMMADRIFYGGAKLPDFKAELVGIVAFMLLAVLGPLLVFSPRLEEAKRTGLREYGLLAQRYVREFEQKWLRGGASPAEQLMGSTDIQSLADFGNSFEVVKSMRWVPFTLQVVLQLAVATLLPVLPLLLTVVSPEELLNRLLKMLF
jgi:hypothetical protein